MLSQHVLSIMRKDECKYSKCMDMFDELVATMEQGQAKRSCNMLFNVANLPQHMFRHRDTLASLILSRTICDQSELDQTVKWIEAQIKINCELSHADILAKLGQRGEELQLFLEDISRIDANSSNL